MIAIAPGKVVLTGAYAVLEGAPAIVAAVNRHARADGSKVDPNPSREVLQVTSKAPLVDASALFDKSGNKLGLGSSAAVLVASIAAMDGVIDRNSIFTRALDAHRKAQGGGSGVDVAASTYGGVLRYRMGEKPTRITLDVNLRVYFSGKSTRTSDFLARTKGADFSALHAATKMHDFLESARATERALEALGRAVDLPIVPPAFEKLARMAEEEDAAFLPSGAGGGDVGVWVGKGTPSAALVRAMKDAGLVDLEVSIDPDGVRIVE